MDFQVVPAEISPEETSSLRRACGKKATDQARPGEHQRRKQEAHVEIVPRPPGLPPLLLLHPLPLLRQFLLRPPHLVLKHSEHIDRLNTLQFRVAVPVGRALEHDANVLPSDGTGEVELEGLEDGGELVHVAAAHFALAGL